MIHQWGEINLHQVSNWMYLRFSESEKNEEEKQRYEKYKEDAFCFMLFKQKLFFPEDLLMLREIGKQKNFEQIYYKMPDEDRYIYVKEIPKYKKTETGEDVWENRAAYTDIALPHIITPSDNMYEDFFIYFIRELDILQIDYFLDYQLQNYHYNNKERFNRLLLLMLRKFENHLMPDQHIETIYEWMSMPAPLTEKLFEIKAMEDDTFFKSKVKREAGDNLTSINMEQTALLIKFAQDARILLKDEYLNNKLAAQAFSVLTGYSAETIRQELCKKEYNPIQNKKNLNDLYNLLTKLNLLIHKRLQGK